MLAFSLHRPTTLAMRELARRVRVERTKAVADGRMVGRMDQPQIWNQTDGAGNGFLAPASISLACRLLSRLSSRRAGRPQRSGAHPPHLQRSGDGGR